MCIDRAMKSSFGCLDKRIYNTERRQHIMSYYEIKTYAKFRHELLTLCPHMDEREIYKNWWMYNTHSEPGADWTLQQRPLRGVDSKYHYLYITTTPKEEIYVGIHSTLNLDDGYQGSGDEIRNCQASGMKLKTTILEFFRTRDEALAMEKYVVNDLFLVEFGVLNKVPGGDDSRHEALEKQPVELTKMSTKQVSVEMPFGDKVEVPVMDGSITPAPKKVAIAPTKKPTTKNHSKNWFSFSRFGIPVGEPLEYIADKEIVAIIVDEDESVKCNGSIWCLNDITNKIAGRIVSNCLAFWSWNGKSLLNIKNEILKKGG